MPAQSIWIALTVTRREKQRNTLKCFKQRQLHDWRLLSETQHIYILWHIYIYISTSALLESMPPISYQWHVWCSLFDTWCVANNNYERVITFQMDVHCTQIRAYSVLTYPALATLAKVLAWSQWLQCRWMSRLPHRWFSDRYSEWR